MSRSSDSNRRADSHSTNCVPSPSSSKSTVMRQSSATRNSYQTERSSSTICSRRGRPRVRLGPRPLGRRGGDDRQLRLRDAELTEALEAREAGELLHLPRRVVAPDRLAEACDLGGGDRLVEAQRRRQADRVEGAVRDPVAAAERLRHRVAEAEPRAPQRGPGVHGALEQLAARLDVATVGENARQRGGDQGGARERLAIGLRVAARDIERLGAVGERVQRRPARFVLGKPERQLRLVDDALDARARRRRP